MRPCFEHKKINKATPKPTANKIFSFLTKHSLDSFEFMFISDLFIWTLWQHHLSQTEEILIVEWFTFSWLVGFSTSFSQIPIGHLFVCLFSSLLFIFLRDASVLFHHSFLLVWDCGVSVRPMLVLTLLELSVSFFFFLIPSPWQLSALQIFPSAHGLLKSAHCFFCYSNVLWLVELCLAVLASATWCPWALSR